MLNAKEELLSKFTTFLDISSINDHKRFNNMIERVGSNGKKNRGIKLINYKLLKI